MWRDGHVIGGHGIAYFPESGKLYALPPETAAGLADWLAGRGEPPAGAAALLDAERARGRAPLPAPDADGGAVRSLCLYTAHDCNLACSYCYNQRGRAVAPLAMMTPETAIAALDRFFTQPGVAYAAALYGGEPLLNVRLLRPLVEHVERRRRADDIRISLSLTTNGTVMNREILELLDRHFCAVTVSLDGPAAINDRHRRYEKDAAASAHDRAVATIRLLKERTALRVTVKGTLTAQGLPFWRESLAYLRSLGADGAALDPAFGPDDADWAIAGNAWDAYVEAQAAAAAADLDDIDETLRPWQEFTFQIVAGLLTKRRLLRHCNIGRDLAVMADGRIYACHGLAGRPEFAMGAVDAPDSPDFIRLHADFSGLDLRAVDGCTGCWARYLCGGGCYANAWYRSGSVRRADRRHCRLFLAVAERVIPAFVATMADPGRAPRLLHKIRGMIAAAPVAHV
jgi:uncharacterized protein